MATFRKRGSSWNVRIQKKGHPVVCRTFDVLADAERWAKGVESDIDRGSAAYLPAAREAEKVTLAEAITRYVQERVPELATSYRVQKRAEAIAARPFAARPLAAIRGKDIADFIRERQGEGVGSQTVIHDLNTISKVYEICRRNWGMVALDNPVKLVDKPSLPVGRVRRLNDDEEKRLLAECDSEFSLIIQFALATAMRRGEIAALTWENVNLQRRTVFLPKTKNGESRTVPLSPDALTVLASLPRAISGRVFPLLRDPDRASKLMARAARRAGLEDLHFQDLRHEATSRLFEETDLDVMEIKGITGHKSMQMLARYAHLRAGRLADRLAGSSRT
ncbi:site-specific integrase [Desulfovibrio sp. TomC]|uniref:site-specific integrase n=1 Tax=Desulfovibrio sp. TomC TaxID=1562888 RepID=UPI0005BA48FC|nr:site-specific integrase [Desulfovibrio sp. TomC]